jgi:hypothetical protein
MAFRSFSSIVCGAHLLLITCFKNKQLNLLNIKKKIEKKGNKCNNFKHKIDDQQSSKQTLPHQIIKNTVSVKYLQIS